MSWGELDIRTLDQWAVHEARPDDLSTLGTELGAVADNLELVSGLLGQVSTYGVWDSPAGETFAAEVGTVPVTLRAVAGRLGDSGELITRYSRTLTTHQEGLERIAAAYEREVATIEEIDRQLMLYSPHPAQDALERRREGACTTAAGQESAYTETADDAYSDEQLLAADLYAVCVDLADPAGYDVLEGTRDLGSSTLFTNPLTQVAKPLRLGTALDPVGQAGLRTVYGQGSWGQIAKDSAVLTADGIVRGSSRVVRRATGAAAPARRSSLLDVTRTGAGSPVPVSSRWGRGKQTVNRWGRGARLGATEQARRTARRESGMDLAEEILGDWEAVAGASRRVKGVQAVGSTTKVVRHGQRTIDNARTRGEQIAEATQGEEDESRTRERADVS